MKIGNIERRQDGDTVRLTCAVEWEGREKYTDNLFVEADCELSADANGFLLAAFLPAWMNGEERIVVDGTVCPVLLGNLKYVCERMDGWFSDFPRRRPEIVAETAYQPPAEEAGAFISGGVDSLATLRVLTTWIPAGHSDRPTAAVLLDYQDIAGLSDSEIASRFSNRKAICQEICADVGLELIPVRTNMRRLNTSMDFWIKRYHGSFLASMAYFLSNRFRMFNVAATYEAGHVAPWGSHPLLDPFYSSHHLRMCHHGTELSRLDKVHALRDWDLALNLMNVCTNKSSGGRNCGRCEKCVRTKLHLLVEDRLAAAGAFAEDDLTAEDIKAIRIGTDYSRVCYEEALPGLKARGRNDLSDAVEHVIKAYAKNKRPGLRRARRIPSYIRGLYGKQAQS